MVAEIKVENRKDEIKKYDHKIQISNDYYEAYIEFEMHDKEYRLTKEEIIEILKTKNIVFGINSISINKIIENPNNLGQLLIAKGIPHRNGVDGEIEFNFDLAKKLKPTLLENGRVDFKHLNFIQKISAGDVLATRTMPTEGANGTTITGKIIKARPGKLANFKFGKNVKMSENELMLIAEVDGTVNIVNDRIEVIKVLEIKGDVGIKTGNIEFSGKVVVNGNVITGYSIKCTEDLEVNGIVESCNLSSKGNITISVGIQGNDSAEIECDGDLICGFMNNCNVRVKGNIESNSIMHSNIVCDGNLEALGKKGLIIGGSIQVRNKIDAKIIGSEMGTITYLKLGLNSEIMERYNYLVKEIKEHKQGIVKLDQAINILKRQNDADPTNLDIAVMLEKTVASREKYQTEFKEMTLSFHELNETINKLKGSKIEVDLIYPGTKIKIGNTFYNVKSILERVIIKKDTGDIIVVSK